MLKIYFKQAATLLRQNPFIGAVAIAGTALSIMMVMVIIVTDEIKTASMSPEINRHRMMLIKHQAKTGKTQQMMTSSMLKYSEYKDYLSGLQTPEATSLNSPPFSHAFLRTHVSAEKSLVRHETDMMATDAAFWGMMSFRFLQGGPYDQGDVEAGLKKAVLSESLARKIFGSTDATGQIIEVNFEPYVVCGVVKDVLRTFSMAYAELWIPYTSRAGYEDGGYRLLLLAGGKKDFDLIVEEVRAAERRHNLMDEEWDLRFNGPYDHRTSLSAIYSNIEPNMTTVRLRHILVISILLVVPAVNLIGFGMSRMRRRTAEMGIRKAFGAKRQVIIAQVISENMVASLIGGLIGLVLSWFIVGWLKSWLLEVGAGEAIPTAALVSPRVFIAVFLFALVINLISSVIPAWKASRMQIVESLNTK